MKILVTGSNGFIGKNLISNLTLYKNIEILKFDRSKTLEQLDEYTKECDFVFHLAGVNRVKNSREFTKNNVELTNNLINLLIKNNNKCPVMVSSSIQAELENDYGKSKKSVEDLIFNYGKENNVKVFVYRFSNVFGKWCKPNYNSVIATWCYNIANDKPIKIDDTNKLITLTYIDDVCSELIKCLEEKETRKDKYCIVPTSYTKTLGEILELIQNFKLNENNIIVPPTGDTFVKDMYATYISYVPIKNLIVDLNNHKDDRGSFCELIRTKESGQVSMSTTNVNVMRGGHYHNTKMERFIVIKGKAKIEFENIMDHSKYEIIVSDEKLQYVTIPVGYQHKINNISNGELILILWANELFDLDNPDTFIMEDDK